MNRKPVKMHIQNGLESFLCYPKQDKLNLALATYQKTKIIIFHSSIFSTTMENRNSQLSFLSWLEATRKYSIITRKIHKVIIPSHGEFKKPHSKHHPLPSIAFIMLYLQPQKFELMWAPIIPLMLTILNQIYL